jgi:hypothetical protein
LHENSLLINEGFATFISLNFSENLFNKLFPSLHTEKLPDEIKISLKNIQNSELEKLKKQTKSYYYLGYKMKEKIFKSLGKMD